MTAEMIGTELIGLRWETVCLLDRLLPERGAAALLAAGGEPVQVALFRMPDGTVAAIGNVDPFSGAAVLSRGIVGDRSGVPTVASPVYKQVFSLVTGECLDDPAVRVPVYPVRVADGWLQVGLP
ncbi:nitrite reductase small subunit NirD [Pseudonocardia kunmingensis]|uniref:Nitrite reductase (NADH) small subunit n=1 Tax=Pseudonocardia kunmingensis TaxID=630975 RepID=A0A543CYS7_9PSEU|nr:nitrite reductase small subunit NirD [Pseudonocardia kunmingensis]TQM02254.1 nitrite reductase (NADH) small subunit [Pseudonocardia kunmingensis]